MIRKMQIKFILLSMSVLLAVLVVIIGTINLINYKSIVREADEILSVLSEYKGIFPKDFPRDHKFLREMSPEIPYESRYFSVVMSPNGEVIQTETGNIAAVNSTDATAMGLRVYGKTEDLGFVDNFRYHRSTEATGQRIIFLDCGRKIGAFRSFLWASLTISLFGFLLVLVVVIFFSGKIIKPFSENYEKQRQFITDAGHELKTPLAIINADVDILEMDYPENEWLCDIQKQVRQLSDLTNDLVFLSRMDECIHSQPLIDFPVSDLVGEVCTSFQAIAMSQNKTFTASIQPLLSMRGEQKAIRQLVSILLDNALKYSPENSTVSLILEKQGRHLRLCVSNTTESPLPYENLDVLFERFYRVDPSRNSQTGGHGIGLSIAKAITSSHGGKIHAVSKDKQSLTITAAFIN